MITHIGKRLKSDVLKMPRQRLSSQDAREARFGYN